VNREFNGATAMKTTRIALFVLGLAGLAGSAAPALAADGTVEGRWLTENQKGVVDISPCGQQICGRLVWMKPDPVREAKDGPPHDQHNPDPNQRQRSLCGLTILYDFKQTDPGDWRGLIYSPEDGQVYHANMHIENGMLKLRGYVGIPLLGETQTWTRPEASVGVCKTS
jgi:uncharacterized protein (DUF2147 family)